jgi:hypothetical protein
MRFTTIISLVLVLACACNRRSGYVQTAPPAKPAVDYAQMRSDYRDFQEKLVSLKSTTRNHIKVYELALDHEDPLNRRESLIARTQIIESATELRAVCTAALENDAMLKMVKGSKRNVRRYAKFADEILAKYAEDAPLTPAAPEEPVATESTTTNATTTESTTTESTTTEATVTSDEPFAQPQSQF